MKDRIKFLDLQTINRRYSEEFETVLAEIIKEGDLILGKNVSLFEEEFAAYCGTSFCLGVANGLDALTLILKAYEIGPGDEVIVPSHTFIATWLSVSNVGATIVPVEVDANTYNLDSSKVEKFITPKTKAIIAVNLYGLTADLNSLLAIANKHSIKLIEDAAQSHGATLDKKRSGSLAHAAAFSFYPGKNLGALGDGGAITTSCASLNDRLTYLRNYGSKKKYQHIYKGYNSRLDEIQAGFLRCKLKDLDKDNSRRNAIAKIYQDQIDLEGLILPNEFQGYYSSWHLFVVRFENRDGLMTYLDDNNITTLIHYPTPPHKQLAYKNTSLLRNALDLTEKISDEVLSLPIGPTMTDSEIQYIVEIINNYQFN